jgi:hypothetical protein
LCFNIRKPNPILLKSRLVPLAVICKEVFYFVSKKVKDKR